MRVLTDTDINAAVRRVLVQHWIDLGRLSIRTTRGVVYLSGSLSKLRDIGANLTTEEINAMMLGIERLAGVRRLQPDLTNVRTFAAAGADGEEHR